MFNKKGSAIVWGIVVTALVIGLIITVLIIVSQKGYLTKKQTPLALSSINLYLKGEDIYSKEPSNGKYIVAYKLNNTFNELAKGNLDTGSLIEVKNIPDTPLYLYGYGSDYYMTQTKKVFTDRERQENISKVSIPLTKIGHLEVKHTGNLYQENNFIKFNITAKDGWVYRTAIAIRWTAGIISISPQEDRILCTAGVWENYTSYDESTNSHEWLPLNNYRCGEKIVEQCEAIEEMVYCKPLIPNIPQRLANKVDEVVYIGKSLAPDESYEFTLNIKTLQYKNELDYVELTFFDHDARFDVSQGIVWVNEEGGVDIAAEDVIHRVYYEF